MGVREVLRGWPVERYCGAQGVCGCETTITLTITQNFQGVTIMITIDTVTSTLYDTITYILPLLTVTRCRAEK
jgi:hypothetical protein